MRKSLIATLAIAFLCSSALAQNLAAIPRIKFDVAEPGREAVRCGLTKQLIQEAIMFPVSSSRIQIAKSDDLEAPSFDAEVKTLDHPLGVCFSSVNLRVHNFQPPEFAEVVIWEYNQVAYAGKDQHAQQIRNIIENATKRFVTEWNLANRPIGR
jgi:hypothetical protein